MVELSGVITPKHDPSIQVAVTVEFLDGSVVISLQKGERLGRWQAIDLDVLYLGWSRFRLNLEGEAFFFDADDPARFALELTEAISISNEPTSWEWLSQQLRRITAHPRYPNEQRRAETKHVDIVLTRGDDLPGGGTSTDADAPSTRATIQPYLQEVVDGLESGMNAWFNFYLRLGGGNEQDRLEEAAGGLEKAAHQLQSIGEQLDDVAIGTGWEDLIAAYERSVFSWASAIELISRACRLDQHALAVDGFNRMGEATALAEQTIRSSPLPRPRADVTGALNNLARLAPPANVSKRSVAEAKMPWRRALLSAGWVEESAAHGWRLSSLRRTSK